MCARPYHLGLNRTEVWRLQELEQAFGSAQLNSMRSTLSNTLLPDRSNPYLTGSGPGAARQLPKPPPSPAAARSGSGDSFVSWHPPAASPGCPGVAPTTAVEAEAVLHTPFAHHPPFGREPSSHLSLTSGVGSLAPAEGRSSQTDKDRDELPTHSSALAHSASYDVPSMSSTLESLDGNLRWAPRSVPAAAALAAAPPNYVEASMRSAQL